MNVSKDIERLRFTITQGNKPNANDAKALNGVIDWVERQRSENVKNGHLFAKAFLSLYAKHLFETDGNYQLSLERATETLKKPLNEVFVLFHDAINDIHRNNALDFWKENPDSEVLYKAAIKSLDEHWSLRATTDRLNELIADMINLYKDA